MIFLSTEPETKIEESEGFQDKSVIAEVWKVNWLYLILQFSVS